MEQLTDHRAVGGSVFERYEDGDVGRVVFCAHNYDGTENFIIINNRTVSMDQIYDAIIKLGGQFDTFTKVHPFNAVYETLVFSMMNGICNEYTEFLRYVYMTDIDFSELMKNGTAKYTKTFCAKLEFTNQGDRMHNFHKIVKVPLWGRRVTWLELTFVRRIQKMYYALEMKNLSMT